MHFVLVLVLSPMLFSWGNAFQFNIDLPDDVKEEFNKCILQSKHTPVIQWQAELACLHSYFTGLGPNNLTDKDREVFNRTYNDGFGHYPPSSGISIRREVRTLSDAEWKNVTDVFRKLFETGTLQSFGRLHGQATRRAHKGAAFLPWHRVFLTHFEQEMRNINPSVSLPYWDYTIDNEIAQPFESVLWTPCYYGENNDVVKTSPFKFLYGAHGAIISRSIARNAYSTRLISKADMDLLKGYCNFKDITTGADKKKETNNLETLHDGVHDYIGGDMGEVRNSAYDPIFWFHHAFIDYIWEDFRKHQTEKCDNIDLESDYRPPNDLGWNTSIEQGPNDTMFGYSHLRNIDGLWLNWTQNFYTYEPQPACIGVPLQNGTSCKGKYLYCDGESRCLTRTREACTEKHSRSVRVQPDNVSLEPKLTCGTGTELKGLKGDGRTRYTSKAECEAILKRLREDVHRPKDVGPVHGQTNSGSQLKTITILLGAILGIVFVV